MARGRGKGKNGGNGHAKKRPIGRYERNPPLPTLRVNLTDDLEDHYSQIAQKDTVPVGTPNCLQEERP
jgi:hypothetical protein